MKMHVKNVVCEMAAILSRGGGVGVGWGGVGWGGWGGGRGGVGVGGGGVKAFHEKQFQKLMATHWPLGRD